MLNLIKNLLHLNTALSTKIRNIQAYDEGLALYSAKNYKAAFPLLKEAAELGNAMAMSLLGTAYLFGQGCPENGREAEMWLLRATEAGHADARGVLGMAYATGKAGCRRDLSQAEPLLRAAAEDGDLQSQQMLDMMHRGKGMFAKAKRRR